MKLKIGNRFLILNHKLIDTTDQVLWIQRLRKTKIIYIIAYNLLELIKIH